MMVSNKIKDHTANVLGSNKQLTPCLLQTVPGMLVGQSKSSELKGTSDSMFVHV